MILFKTKDTILKKILSSILVLTVVMSSLWLGVFKNNTVQASAISPISNGDFENGLDGYDYADIVNATVIEDTERASNVLKLESNTDKPYGSQLFWQEVTVEAGKTYVWKFSAKATNTNNSFIGVVSEDGATLLASSITCTNNACIDTTKSEFTEERDASAVGTNWHPGLKTAAKDTDTQVTDWQEYTISFNSGEHTTVLLSFNLWAGDRAFYLDDMTLEQVNVVNAGFEDGLFGYKEATNVAAEVVTDADKNSNVLHLKGETTTAGTQFFWQEVKVEAGKKYEWKFSAKATNGNVSLVGVRSADGTKLLASSITCTDSSCLSGTLEFAEERNIDTSSAPNPEKLSNSTNWHTGIITGNSNNTWQDYTVTFESGEHTTVLLSFNLWYNTREIYVEDMSLEMVDKSFTNGDFENGLTRYEYESVTPTVVTDTDRDSNVLNLTTSVQQPYNSQMFWQEVEVEKNKTYIWKFSAKTTTDNVSLIGVRNADGTKLLASSIDCTNSSCFLAAYSEFTDERDISDLANSAVSWHQGIKTGGSVTTWQDYTVTFNSGEHTTVLLTFNLRSTSRDIYIDDMSLLDMRFTNGDFEDGLTRYESAATVTASVLTDAERNSNVLKLESNAATPYGSQLFWQEVAVEANKTYVWKFSAKATNPVGTNSFIGVRSADGETLLASSITCTGNNCIDPGTVEFSDGTRTASAIGNWHIGLRTGAVGETWQDYTITFESGEHTTVLLSFNLWAGDRLFYLDDMSLEEANKVETKEFTNGDFENGLEGYQYSDTVTATIAEYTGKDTAVLKLESDTATPYGTQLFWQEVTVEAGKTYVWKFSAKATNNKNSLIGVRSADGTKLLASSVTCTNAYCVDTNFLDFDLERDVVAGSSAGWHPGLKIGGGNITTWQDYTVMFYSGEHTTVLLSFNLWADDRAFYVDDMSLEEVVVENVGLENADFESEIELEGYEAEYLTTEISTDVKHGGDQALKFTFNDDATTYDRAMLYRTVDVKPNTNYKWSFWYYSIAGGISLVGVRTADGTKLLPSRFITENNGYLSTNHSAFEDIRAVETANWHQGLYSAGCKEKWKKYTVVFNSGNRTQVSLTINHRATGRSGITDDWSLEEYTEHTEFLNSGFEQDAAGYQSIGDIALTPVLKTEDSYNVFEGDKALKIESTGETDANGNDVLLYQEIAVEPNSIYEWSFWFKSSGEGNKLIGVRTANGYQLLPSEIKSTDMSSLVSTRLSFEDIRDMSVATNWHQGVTNEYWTHYTVTFKTNDETVVIPTVNLYTGGRSGYTDNWSITKIDADGIVLNGDFEAKVTDSTNDPAPRYEFADTTEISVTNDPDDNANNALYVEGTDAKVTQTVAVTPYTEYEWNFKLKNEGELLNGVYVSAEGSTIPLPSVFESTDGGKVESDSAVLIGTESSEKMHYGANNTEWKQYNVRFYSSDCKYVTLNMNFGAAGYTDNWSLNKNVGDWGDTNYDAAINSVDLTNMRLGLFCQNSESSLAGLDANVDGAIDICDLVNMDVKASADTSYGEYELVWQDNFDGASLNSNKWSLTPHLSAQNDLVMLSDGNAVNVKDGKVTLSAGRLTDSKFYTNTSLTTSETMIFQYGYVEMRAKVPSGKGAWPTFWMKSSKDTAYRNNPNILSEIDIFEIFATDPAVVESNCHKWYEDGTGDHYDLTDDRGNFFIGTGIDKSSSTLVNDEINGGWHTFGLLWTPEKLEFYVDRDTNPEPYMTINISITDESSAVDIAKYDYGERKDGLKLHHDYHYLILDNYLTTKYGKKLNDNYADADNLEENISKEFEIDYVRIYQKPNEGDLISLN